MACASEDYRPEHVQARKAANRMVSSVIPFPCQNMYLRQAVQSDVVLGGYLELGVTPTSV